MQFVLLDKVLRRNLVSSHLDVRNILINLFRICKPCYADWKYAHFSFLCELFKFCITASFFRRHNVVGTTSMYLYNMQTQKDYSRNSHKTIEPNISKNIAIQYQDLDSKITQLRAIWTKRPTRRTAWWRQRILSKNRDCVIVQ